jgi:hypothetical protein
MILPARCRPHTHQFRHGGDDSGPAEPAEQEAVDETGRAAVEQAEDEETKHGFPGYGRSAGDAEDGEGREGALRCGSVGEKW